LSAGYFVEFELFPRGGQQIDIEPVGQPRQIDENIGDFVFHFLQLCRVQ